MARKTTCLLLALVFSFAYTVPAVWGDGTPGSEGGQIHPWDNNDEFHSDKGPLQSVSKPVVIIRPGPGGFLTVSWTRISYTRSQTSAVASKQKSRLERTAQVGSRNPGQR